MSDLIGVREAASVLGVHENTIRSLCARGLLVPAQRLPYSGYRRFARSDVERLRDDSAGSPLPDTEEEQA